MSYAPSTFAQPFKAPTQRHAPKPTSGRIAPIGYTKVQPHTTDSVEEPGLEIADDEAGPSNHKNVQEAASAARQAISEKSFYAPKPKSKAEKIVIGEKSSRQRTTEWGGARHDPKAEGAVVMQRPKEADAAKR